MFKATFCGFLITGKFDTVLGCISVQLVYYSKDHFLGNSQYVLGSWEFSSWFIQCSSLLASKWLWVAGAKVLRGSRLNSSAGLPLKFELFLLDLRLAMLAKHTRFPASNVYKAMIVGNSSFEDRSIVHGQRVDLFLPYFVRLSSHMFVDPKMG